MKRTQSKRVKPVNVTEGLASSQGQGPDPQEIAALISLFSQGKYAQAKASAQAMTTCFPSYAFGWKVLGAVFQQVGNSADALAPMRRAATLSPGDAETYVNLGIALQHLGQLDGAVASYRRALEISPDFASAYNYLGSALKDLGQMDAAVGSYTRALAINPDYAEAHNNLGIALKDLGQVGAAVASYRRALELNPKLAVVHNNLGNVLFDTAELDSAEASYRRALEIYPDYADAHNNLGNVLKDRAALDVAEASFRRAIEIKPDFAAAHSNLLFTRSHQLDFSGAMLLTDSKRYGDLVSRSARPYSAWRGASDPDKSLRVGLVSGDLRQHPVGNFLEGVLSELAPNAAGRVELFGYSNAFQVDIVSERIKTSCRGWHSVVGLSDEALARQIHDDHIDILIDLSGHTAHNRLAMFAWKPAPIQITWLGYAGTTGVSAIDYLIADHWTIPTGEEKDFTENVLRLPETLLCFTPPDTNIQVGTLPALTNGYVTFGSFNNLSKINDRVINLWARVLDAVPNSRLILKTRQLQESSIRKVMAEKFANRGIEIDRLVLAQHVPRAEYLLPHLDVDIALDTFPYTGVTTSIESLWMGVPVLSLAGDRFMSRFGESILQNAALPECIAEDLDDYVSKAIHLSSDLVHLASLRQSLRSQVLSSPLFDAPRFARNFELALREVWKQWCNQQRGH